MSHHREVMNLIAWAWLTVILIAFILLLLGVHPDLRW